MECVLKAIGVTKFLFRIEPHRTRHDLLLKSAEKKGMVKSLGQHGKFSWWERTAA
jgi:hypothetical protein